MNGGAGVVPGDVGISLQTYMIAGFTRGTQQEPLPLLPSGPGGVHGVPLREARLSYSSANSLLG